MVLRPIPILQTHYDFMSYPSLRLLEGKFILIYKNYESFSPSSSYIESSKPLNPKFRTDAKRYNNSPPNICLSVSVA